MKILANDGISQAGIECLEKAGFTVETTQVEQESLADYINQNQVRALLVRSATKVRSDLIDACPDLKLIGRGGVGMDNIDVDYARGKGIEVINTPGASCVSVAELVFAHLFGLVRNLHDSNRNFPLEGETNFKGLKKRYGKGQELRGKTIGIIGFGGIGREVAKRAIGLGMKVLFTTRSMKEEELYLEFFDGQELHFELSPVSLEHLLRNSDVISLNVPKQKRTLIGREEIALMKDGVFIVNTARGGVVDENALIDAIDEGKVAAAALDVFSNEPQPNVHVLMHPGLSLSPHIGGATKEAQSRIGTELAEKIIRVFAKQKV